jgi:hypothetical protein
MRSGGALVAAVAALLVSGSARADPEVGIAFSGGLVLSQPNVASSRFSGAGFESNGRDFGARRPVLLGGEVRITFLARYFEAGGQFFYASDVSGAETADDPAAARLANAASLTAAGGGFHFAATVPLGVVTFVLGPDLGVRRFAAPLPGLPPTACAPAAARRAPDDCRESAASTEPYVQPRFGVILQERQRRGFGLFVKPWVGADVYPSVAWAAGITIGVGSEHGRLSW